MSSHQRKQLWDCLEKATICTPGLHQVSDLYRAGFYKVSTGAERVPLSQCSCTVTEMSWFLFLTDCEDCLHPRALEPEISIAQGNTASKHIHFSFLVTGGRKTCCVHRSVFPPCLVQSLMSLLSARARAGLGSPGGVHPITRKAETSQTHPRLGKHGTARCSWSRNQSPELGAYAGLQPRW